MPNSDTMIELNSLTAILGLELLVVLVIALAILVWRMARRGRKVHTKASGLVARINSENSTHLEDLGERLFESTPNFPPDLREQSMTAIAAKENELYRHVIRAFLDQDMDALAALDRHVHGLSEPYCQIVAALIEHLPKPAPQGDTRELEQRLAVAESLATENQAVADHINAQLTLALNTLDEVSSEYTKIFNSPKLAEELTESRKRMLAAFRRTEQSAELGLLPELHLADPEKD